MNELLGSVDASVVNVCGTYVCHKNTFRNIVVNNLSIFGICVFYYTLLKFVKTKVFLLNFVIAKGMA